MEIHNGLPIHLFASQQEWLDWLAANHVTAGVWVKMAKKGSGITAMSYYEAVEGALRYGWIDGLINKWDERCYATRFTPRKPKSVWSKANRDIVEGLTDRGLMEPSGLAAVAAAKQNGTWDAAYDSQSAIECPEDFTTALNSHPEAARAFSTLDAANRYAFLFRLQTAANPQTRAARIQKFVGMLESGELFHPPKNTG